MEPDLEFADEIGAMALQSFDADAELHRDLFARVGISDDLGGPIEAGLFYDVNLPLPAPRSDFHLLSPRFQRFSV